MGLSVGTISLFVASFLASGVEFVEAFTIVLAMGLTRSWRATLIGTGAAVLMLAVVTGIAGVALVHTVSEALLQIIIGTLLLIFGLQWLRKSILRSSGLKAMHDEDAIFRKEQEEARKAGHETRLGLDWFAFVVSFKGVFLEGLEVVFIVITFGLTASQPNVNGILLAAEGAALAGLLVIIAGSLAHRPLSTVPENTMKYVVGLLLSTFGTFWSVEGLGYFGSGQSLEWPGQDLSLLGVLIAWILLSQLAIAGLSRLPGGRNARTVSVISEVGVGAGH
ncbi:MAG TPA: hypothetical protein VKX96_11755 [Chloroflexota bacterium]|nr:hypothetical protein [Chloroflexota bacterium]